jgi:GST-like protein
MGAASMIDLYTWMTDNGYKARHMMEESGLEHTIKPVNLRERAQFAPEFLQISPGHKIPAIVDHDGPGGARISLCESGAILKYLGEKCGNGLYPSDPVARVKVDQWLFYGSATFTTLAQQYGHFVVRSTEDVPAAKKHFDGLLRDMLGTLDRHLATREYVADAYSVADISMYPDVHLHGVKNIGLDAYPNVRRWHDAIAQRPATQRGWTPFA